MIQSAGQAQAGPLCEFDQDDDDYDRSIHHIQLVALVAVADGEVSDSTSSNHPHDCRVGDKGHKGCGEAYD